MNSEDQKGLFQINSHVLQKLDKLRLNLDQLLILDSLYEDRVDILQYHQESNSDVSKANYLKLARKSYIAKDIEDEYYITNEGIAIYKDILNDSNDKSILVSNIKDRKLSREDMFNEWWSTFPLSSQWKHNDKVFTGTRTLRVDKKTCKAKYESILNNGVYSHQDLMNALKYEIRQRKLESIKKGENTFQFMKGSSSYLNQEYYVGYIHLYRDNPEFVKDCIECKDNYGNIDIIVNDDISSSNSDLA